MSSDKFQADLDAYNENVAVAKQLESTDQCPECGGKNLWTTVGPIGPQKYCRDCYFLCDCGRRYRKSANQKCPSCTISRSTKSDTQRVAEWMELICRDDKNTPQLVENLGRIGPAGRVAIPLLREIYRKDGKSGVLGCLAYDAIREHEQFNQDKTGRPEPATATTQEKSSRGEPATARTTVICSRCSAQYKIEDTNLGKRGKCKKCNTTFVLSAPLSANMPSQSPAASEASTSPSPAQVVPAAAGIADGANVHRALDDIDVICSPWWMVWIKKAEKERALKDVVQLAKKHPDVRRAVFQVAIERGAVPLVDSLIQSGVQLAKEHTDVRLAVFQMAIKRGAVPLAELLIRSDVQFAKEHPDVRRAVFQMAIKRGDVPYIESLILWNYVRDWDATCAAIACPNIDVRSAIAKGMSYYDDPKSLVAAKDHPELIPALHAALRQGGGRGVMVLLLELADKEVVMADPEFHFNDVREQALRAMRAGTDPKIVFAKHYSTYHAAYPKSDVSVFAEQAIREVQEGKFGLVDMMEFNEVYELLRGPGGGYM